MEGSACGMVRGCGGIMCGTSRRGSAADRVQQVRDQGEVDHLLDEDSADQLGGVRVAFGVEGVERRQVRRQCGVLDLDRPLQVPAQVFQGRDAGRRGGGGRGGLVVGHGGEAHFGWSV